MAGIFFSAGETKVRPNVYQRYEKPAERLFSGVQEGVVACAVRTQWGPLNQVMRFASAKEAASALGGAVGVISEAFDGGALTVLAVRVGASGSGSASTGTLMATGATEEDPESAAITVTAKYPGARPFAYAVRQALDASGQKEFLLYSGDMLLETLRFAASSEVTEVDALIAAGAQSGYMTFEKVEAYAGTGTLSSITLTQMTTGTAVTAANADYSAAFTALEPHPFNCLCLDSGDTALHALAHAFVNRVYQDGKPCLLVVGEPASTETLSDRLAHAAAFNDYQVVYVGGGWEDASGNVIEGPLAAARVAGLIAATPTTEAVTHKVIAGAVAPSELLTTAQYDQAVKSGMLTFSHSWDNQVWLDSGVTTLVAPSGQDGAGWMKIKRVKVRFEVMNRVAAAAEPLIGVVPNSTDGRAAIMQAAQAALNAMISAGKLAPGALIELDGDNLPQGDSVWFKISFQDVDAVEKVYLLYSIGLA